MSKKMMILIGLGGVALWLVTRKRNGGAVDGLDVDGGEF